MELFWIWLSQLKGFSRDAAHLFWELGLSPKELYDADVAELTSFGFPEKDAALLLQKDLSKAEDILRDSKEKGIRLLTPDCEHFPLCLRSLDKIPFVLYYLGDFPDFDRELTIAIVGHRKALESSRYLASRISHDLAERGVIILSGAAEGIDSSAMSSAIKTGGRAVGVLGNGVDHVYPACNRALFSDTVQSGCLISEYPPGTLPAKWQFPERNRLISALSHGVLIVEASKKSGSMITASHALEQGKDLFAVPGTAGEERFSGVNDLIRQGAYLTESSADILEYYASTFDLNKAPDKSPNSKSENASPISPDNAGSTEAKILSALGNGPVSADELSASFGLGAADVSMALTMLQIKGMIRSVPGGAFVRI